jgi:hypothetical protein
MQVNTQHGGRIVYWNEPVTSGNCSPSAMRVKPSDLAQRQSLAVNPVYRAVYVCV